MGTSIHLLSVSVTLLLIICLQQFVECYQNFQSLIPNGDNVGHPCMPNMLWRGVGHFNPNGGGSRNPFGVDFFNNGKQWTQALCTMDSDGDGRSNGEELGDPNCVWTPGQVPARTTGITHPGVCEPITSPKCQANVASYGNTFCQTPQFQCDATQNANVSKLTLNFTRTNIPSLVTNYYCQAFLIPATTQYHLIATQPLIDNTQVMHHILAFGCTVPPTNPSMYTTPYACSMGTGQCQSLIGLWSVGISGECFDSSYGISIGKNGFPAVVLQFHWNNIEMRSDLYDASGLSLYLTPNLRPNEGGVLTVGQMYLDIPPQQAVVVQRAEATAQCAATALLGDAKTQIYLAASTIHMHYSGSYGQVEQYRAGSKLKDIVPYGEVLYDQPKVVSLIPSANALTIGDSLKLLCQYKTTNNVGSRFYGESTQDEMCFAFTRYYPKIRYDVWVSFGDIDYCMVNINNTLGLPLVFLGCNFTNFISLQLPALATRLADACNLGIPKCQPNCKNVVRTILTNPCMKGWPRIFLNDRSRYLAQLQSYRLMVEPCEQELLLEAAGTTTQVTPSSATGTSASDFYRTALGVLIGGCVAFGLVVIALVTFGLVKAFLPKAQGSAKSAKYTVEDSVYTTGETSAEVQRVSKMYA